MNVTVILILLYLHIIQLYTYTYIYAEYILTQWIKTSEDFFKKNIPLTLFERVVCVRGSWRLNKDCNILTPTLMAISIVSFSFSWCSTGGPGAHSAGFLYCILSPTGLIPKLHRGSREPLLLDGGFPYHTCLQLVWSPTPDFLSPPSYIIVQSPTQSLEWHVWSSSSGNNCNAVHRSLSSGASVYECIMGFYLVPFFQPHPPTRFLLITTIGMCQFLPVHHFGMACLAGSRVNMQQLSLETFELSAKLKKSRGIGIQRKYQDHSTFKSSRILRDYRILTVTQTSEKNHLLKWVWKTGKRIIIIKIIISLGFRDITRSPNPGQKTRISYN